MARALNLPTSNLENARQGKSEFDIYKLFEISNIPSTSCIQRLFGKNHMFGIEIKNHKSLGKFDMSLLVIKQEIFF